MLGLASASVSVRADEMDAHDTTHRDLTSHGQFPRDGTPEDPDADHEGFANAPTCVPPSIVNSRAWRRLVSGGRIRLPHAFKLVSPRPVPSSGSSLWVAGQRRVAIEIGSGWEIMPTEGSGLAAGCQLPLGGCRVQVASWEEEPGYTSFLAVPTCRARDPEGTTPPCVRVVVAD